jgi:alpha/beta superfamily hydrolase
VNIHRLKIAGRTEIDNTFFRATGTARKAALVLPGSGYTCHKPILYYLSRVLVEDGFDVLNLQYDYRELNESDFEHIGLQDVLVALEVLKSQGNYTELVIAGKSLGTMVMALLMKHAHWPMKEVTKKLVWLTPIWGDERWFSQMLSVDIQSLHVIGKGDPQFSSEHQNKLQKNKKTQFHVVSGADHSMEIGNLAEDLKILHDLIEAARAFCRASSGGASAKSAT